MTEYISEDTAVNPFLVSDLSSHNRSGYNVEWRKTHANAAQ